MGAYACVSFEQLRVPPTDPQLPCPHLPRRLSTFRSECAPRAPVAMYAPPSALYRHWQGPSVRTEGTR